MRVVVGRIGRPHGIRGEVTVEVRTDEPDEVFAPGAQVLASGPERSLRIAQAHWHSGRLLVRIVGCEDRTAAEALRGTLLEIERAVDIQPDDPDEFYDHALIDCTVVRIDGSVVGTVAEVLHLPGQDVLVIARDQAAEALVPFVSAFVPTIDVPGRRIVIDPPPGLLDADQSHESP